MSSPTFLDLILIVILENLNSLGNVCATINGPYYITCVFCKFLNNMYVIVKTLHVVVKKHYRIIIVNNNDMYVVVFLIIMFLIIHVLCANYVLQI